VDNNESVAARLFSQTREVSMNRVLSFVLLLLVTAVLSCSKSEKSTTCCDEACKTWDRCGWAYETCMTQCTAEGDWCGSYIVCIRGKSCPELLVCE